MENKIIIWFLVIAAVITVGWFGWQDYLSQRLSGDWRATFQVDPENKNAEQVNSLKLDFYRDGVIVYEIKESRSIATMDVWPNASEISSGNTQTKRIFTGKFKLLGKRVHAEFPAQPTDAIGFEPFVINGFGIDKQTGKSFVKLSLRIDFADDKLVIQGYDKGPKVVLAKTPEGFLNPIFKSARNSRDIMSETTEIYVDGKQLQRHEEAPRAIAASTESLPESTPLRMPEQPDNTLMPPAPERVYSGSIPPELRTISTACETYATANNGNYPSSIEELTGAQPAYLTRPYCGETIDGFAYVCDFSETGYEVRAEATTGSEVFAITTGGVPVKRK